MNKTPATISLVMCVLGLLVGFNAKRQISGTIKAKDAVSASKPERQSSREPTARGNAVATPLPKIHSEETLETMIAQGESATYAGLALWMLDASGPDIAAYWEFRKNGKLDGDMKRLLFINWTRLDPQAAIASTAGTKDATIPWWAWASHDPQAALSAADPDRLKDVARGIGEFQPEWLREHFDLIPEEAQREALNGLMTWKEDGDHVATLDFLKKHGIDFHSNLFRTLARKDPWAAYDWLQKNDKLNPGEYGPIDILLDTMKSTHPDDLERLAAMTPSGALKRKMEDAIFNNLLLNDPEAALAKAKATDAPLVAAGRLGQIGLSLLGSDPEKAFGIGADILAVSPESLAPEMRIENNGNSSSWNGDKSTAEKFLSSLLLKDPARTLELTTTGSEAVSKPFRELSEEWAERDLTAYTNWVNRQTDPRIQDAAAGQVVRQLATQGHFQEAVQWALGGEAPERRYLSSLTRQWARSDRGEASVWLESADLPEAMKGKLRNLINSNE